MAFDIQGYHEKYKDFYGDVPLDEVAKDAFTRGGYDKEYPDYDTWKKATGIESDVQTDLKKRTPKTWEDKLSEGVANVTPGFIPKDISTSFVKGATLNYVPSVETPADAGILRKGAVGAAHLAGMSVPIGIAALALPEAATVGGVILTSGALGGLYGLLRKPEEGEDRLSNAAKDAAMFATFGVGGKVIGAGLKKLFPETVGKVFEKIAAKQELTPGEKAIYSASQYGSSATLGMGAGATESADTWEQRLQNIAVGGITFAGAHGISSNLMKLVREGKATPDQLEYIKKLEAGANTSTIIDEGLKTGKIGEEVFTPNHALDLIKTANDSGVYSTEDVAKLKDRYENKYPDLKQGLNNILKDSIKNEISFGIDVGLKAGKLRGRDFTSDDALEVIKDGREKGIYTDADIDSFRDKYPTLKQGLNDIVVDSVKNKVNEALKITSPVAEEGKKTELNKIIPKRNIETDVPLKLGEPVDEIIKTKVSREIIDLQTNIAKREKYLAGNKSFEGTDMYKKNVAVLGQDKAKLEELIKPPEAIIPPEDNKSLAGKEPPATIDYTAEAKKAGVTFNGLQESKTAPPMPVFTDPETKSTFMLNEGESVSEALSRKRQQFAAAKKPAIEPVVENKESIEKFAKDPNIVLKSTETEDGLKQYLENKEGKQIPVDDAQAEHFVNTREKEATKPKEPWEMTREEFKKQAVDRFGAATEESDNAVGKYHKQQITYALEFGKPVSPEVLKDYPELTKGTQVKEKKSKKISIPENVVTRIMQEGGINFGEDYQKKYLKEYPDLKRVFKTTGKKPDAIANILKEEGYDIKNGDDLIEKLKTSEARNVLNPEKQDVIISRKIKGLENDYITRELANLDEKIDAGAVTESYPDIQNGVLEALRVERDISPAQEEAVLAELNSFFSSLPKLPESSRAFVSDMEAKGQAMVDAGLFKEKQTEIPGASAKETFNLANSETEISPKLSEQVKPKNAEMFTEKTEEDKAKFSDKPQPGNVTIATIKNHPRFQSATVTENKDGSAQVIFRNGDGFKVDFITDMADKGVKLETSYGNFKKDANKKVAGAYVEENKTILFNKDRAGIPTIDHEHIHFLEKSGYLDSRDTRILNMGAKKSGFDLTEEGRADFVAQAFQKRDKQVGVVKQVLQKIGDFFDMVMNAVGHRTTGGVLRDIESGKIMEAKGEKGNAIVPVSYSLQDVDKSIEAMKEKLNKFTDKADAVKNAKDGFGLAYDGMKRAFYPSARTEAANKAAETIIGQMGKNFHQQALLKGKLNEVVNHYRESTSVAAKTLDLMQTSTGILADGIFNKMPKEKQWDFIYRIQKGQKQENQELQGIADTLSKMYDDLYRDSESVTPGAVRYRKGYFPGMWEDATAAEKFFSDRLKSMEGSKAFIKEKIFDDIQAGIEAGLKPKGTPIDMAFAKMHEVQKYVTTHRVLQEMETDKTAILVKSGEREPTGYVFVPEPYGVVTRKEKVNLAGKQMDLSKELPGTPKMESYRYAVKDDVAQVFQNYLSRSLYENKYVGNVYEGYMNAANTLNQFQLGVGSAFHAGFTTMEAVISKFALGVKAMARGDVPEAIKLMAASPLQVYKNPALGDKLLRAYRGESVSGQEIPQLVKWLEMAGGRATMDSRFRTSSTDKMIEAWTKGNKISAVVRSPFAMVEQMARPILEWLVPRQKFGVFAEMATEWHKQNPNATHEETRSAMQYVWNRVDSRLGQVVYERLFTQNVAKNIVQGLVRAPGWSGGTIIEIGGGINDFAKVFNDIAHGRKPQMTDKMAYTISLLTITGLINGVMTKLLTGENPQDGMDLLAFRTGKKDEHGNPERFLLPTYAKDIYAYINKPGTTLLNKTHPLLSLMADIAKNKDYYGVAVRDKETNLAVQTGQTGLYAAKAFVPFWMRGAQKTHERGDTLASMLSPLVGIMPATAEFTKTNAQKLMSEILQERPKGTMTKEKFETNRLKSKLETRLRNHDPEASADMQQYLKDGKLSRKDVITIQKAVRVPYTVHAFQSLSLKEAMRVYSVGTPEEKKIFLPLLRKKSHLLKDLPEEERQDTLAKFRQVISG